MADSKEKAAKQVVDISDFFTKDRKEEGVWHEPVIEGKRIGILFKVIGSDADSAATVFADYDKEIEKLDSVEDPEKKIKGLKEVQARTSAKLVKDIKAQDGYEALINGEPLAYSEETVYRIFINATSIAADIISFSRRDGNFMVKK